MNSANIRLALGNHSDLTTPTSSRVYPLGSVYEEYDDSSAMVKKYMYVKSHAALTAYVPYLITNSIVAGAEWVTAAPATLASAVNLIGVPQVAFTSMYYGFVQISGSMTAAVDRATTSGWTLECLNSGVSLTGQASTELVGTIGLAVSSTTAAGNATVILSGRRAEIRATT